jgi:hypothetical protein
MGLGFGIRVPDPGSKRHRIPGSLIRNNWRDDVTRDNKYLLVHLDLILLPLLGGLVLLLLRLEDVALLLGLRLRLHAGKVLVVDVLGDLSRRSRNLIQDGHSQGCGSGSSGFNRVSESGSSRFNRVIGSGSSGFNRISGSGFEIRIRIQEGKTDPQK